MTMGAPSIYAFVRPGAEVDMMRAVGSLLAVAAVLAFVSVLLIRRVRLDQTGIVLLFTTFSIMVPFLLPSMHERYFMQAEVLAVVAAFWLPRRLWFLPVLTQVAVFIGYQSYLFRSPSAVDLRILTLLAGAALVATAAQLLRHTELPDEPELPEVARTPARDPERVPALV